MSKNAAIVIRFQVAKDSDGIKNILMAAKDTHTVMTESI